MANTVCAVVVTYNRKHLLLECLEALRRQTRPVDAVYLVDNGSTDGTPDMLLQHGYIKALPPEVLLEPWESEQKIPNLRNGLPIRVHYVRMHTNTGGAGGFYEGMKRAYERGYDWLWLMDDDCKPETTCLENLFSGIELGDVLVPVLVDSLGRRYGAGYWRGRWVAAPLEGQGPLKVDMFSFAGPLISSRVVAGVGYPRKDFFIWADDVEYALRVKKWKGRVFAMRDAVIYHDYGGATRRVERFGRVSIRSAEPPWKYYYGTRNTILIIRSHLNFKESVFAYLFFVYLLIRQTLGDLLYENDWKARAKYRWLGFLHGLVGIAGRTVDPQKKVDKSGG